MSLVATSLARRRANEKIVNERVEFLKEECNATSVAQWEQRTMSRILKQEIQNRVTQFSQKEEISLQQRQSKLKELYHNDVKKWNLQFDELQTMSADERLEIIRQQAEQLRTKRENENQTFVSECYDRRWRDECDELRTLHSKAITERVMNDRSKAFRNESTGSSNEKSKRDSDKFGSIVIISQEENTEEKSEEDGLRNRIEIKAALDAQMEYIKKRSITERDERMKEEVQKLELWKEEDRLAKVKASYSRQAARKVGDDIQLANARKKANIEMEEAQQRQEDLILLRVAMKKEKKEIELEERRKNEGKEAALEHLFFLRKQMIREKEETETVDTTRKVEMERILNRRENIIRCQNEEKRKLLADVNQSRLRQIKEKEIRNREEKEAIKKQVSISLQELREEEKEENERAMKKKQETVQNMLANKQAMEEKAKQKAKEREEQLRFHRNLMKQEEEVLRKIEIEAKSFKDGLDD